LKKDTRLSKFKKKYDEGFLLGYTTTSKAYRVYQMLSNSNVQASGSHDQDQASTSGAQVQNLQ
jgi:hypothetical protein